jgi:glycine C-acetyltransferase
MVMVNDLRENYGIFLSIVIYPVIRNDFITSNSTAHTLADIDETLVALKPFVRN